MCVCVCVCVCVYKSIFIHTQVTEFYLHQMGTGQLHYVPHEWWIWMASSDSFTISILLETHNASVFINTIYNHSIALAWSWVNPTHTSYLVRESDSPLELTFRSSIYLQQHINSD